MHLRRLSFVIPVKDEEGSIGEMLTQLNTASALLGFSIEVILVDDGSRDSSWRRICDEVDNCLAQERIKAVKLRRNLGKADALGIGFSEATGEVIFTMDADLQDDPKEIGHFLRKLDEGFDVVSGWKRIRHDPWHKVFPSRVFNSVASVLTGVKLHDHNCGFKCYSAKVVKDLALYGGMHRMIPALSMLRGYRTAEIEVEHHPRRFGKSKYGFRRFYKGFLDLITVFAIEKFRHSPLHLAFALSLVSGLLAILSFVIGLCLFDQTYSWALLTIAGVFAGGVLPLFGAGVLAEIALFYWMNRSSDRRSVIEERISSAGEPKIAEKIVPIRITSDPALAPSAQCAEEATEA